MRSIDVSKAVWDRLLAVREDKSCTCCGDFSAAEQAALRLYGPLARRDLSPATIAQVGQSLDGRIATASGEVGHVSGPDGLTHLHRMRALVDAVVIGVRTAIHDSPQLTVRHCEGVNPARVVIDPSARLSDDSSVFQEDGARRIVIQAVDTPRANGLEVIRLPLTEGKIDPTAIIKALHREGLSNILIEGGSFTIAKFLEAGLLDRIQIAVAPVLIGSGPAGINLPEQSENMADALRPATEAYAIGNEVVFDSALTKAGQDALEPRHKTQS